MARGAEEGPEDNRSRAASRPEADEIRDHAAIARALGPSFELGAEIGRGGMGIVYGARDVLLDRQVAVKSLPRERATHSGARARFLKEARTLAKLSHEHIVPIFRAEEVDDVVLLVMALVDGPSLAQVAEARVVMAPREVVRHAIDVARALHYAHANGVIHRDIKLENILIDRATGRAMVTDFGIARVKDAGPRTQTGSLPGTAHYMSPEQVRREPIDGRSDLYALAVVCYRLLTGEFPLDDDLTETVLDKHAHVVPRPVCEVNPDVPAAIGAIVDQCLRKHPAERPESGDALVRLLRLASGIPAGDAEMNADLGSMVVIGNPDAPPAGEPDPTHGCVIVSIDDATTARDPWVGSAPRIGYEVFVPRPSTAADSEGVIRVLQRRLEDPGSYTTRDGGATWNSTAKGRSVEIVVTPSHGRTTIRVAEDLRPLWESLLHPIMLGGAVAAGIGVPLGVALLGSVWGGLAIGAAWMAGLFVMTRVLFRHRAARRDGELRALAVRLGAEVRG